MGYKVVAVEEMSFYHIDEADQSLIERIEGVYFYNADEVTHICSLDTHYWLQYLYTNVIVAEGVDDDTRETLEMKYGQEPGQDDYHPTRSIDRIEGQVELEPPGEDETEDDLREFLQGNHVI